MGKCCFEATYPVEFRIDVSGNPFNVKRFNTWHWYTSNDTASTDRRNITGFEVFVTNDLNDRNSWMSLDKKSRYSTTHENYSLGYEGKLTLYK